MNPIPQPPNPQEVREARDIFIAWLRWYMEEHPDEVPTQTELATRLGVGRSTITPLFEKGSTRAPSFRVLLAARRLIGFPLDALVSAAPPSRRKR